MIHPTLRGHFGARVDGNIKLSNFFDEMRLKKVIEATEVVEAVENIEAAEVSDAREITQYVRCRLFLIFRGQRGC
jgi:hypothetical protein